MTQEQFDFLCGQPIMDGKTVLHYSENNTYIPFEERYIKNLSKICIKEANIIIVTIFINIKEKDQNIDTIYNGQKIFTDISKFDLDAAIFIANLNSLILTRHGETTLNNINITINDIN